MDAHINPGHLTISRRSPDYIGEALAPQWDNLGKLYTKYQQGGRLSTPEMRQFQTTRKLLQLANIVRETQIQGLITQNMPVKFKNLYFPLFEKPLF